MSVVAVGISIAVAGCQSAMPEVTPQTFAVSPTVASGDTAATVTPTVPSSPTPSRPVSRRVAVVGDSLTVAVQDRLDAALGETGFDVVGIDALTGRRIVHRTATITSGIDGVRAIQAANSGPPPDIWVIALGTNDVGGSEDTERIVTDAAQLIALLNPDATIVWVDVYVRELADESWAFDRAIRGFALDRPNITVLDWFHAAERDGMLLPDGVHLTDQGAGAFTDLIVGGVAEVVENRDAKSVPATTN